jgi:hypothetical protein
MTAAMSQTNPTKLPPAEVALAITRKKALYGRWADTKQWHRYHEIALPDATFRYFNQDGSIIRIKNRPADMASPDAFAAYFGSFFRTKESLHNFGLGDMEMVGPGEVRAVWALEDMIFWTWVPLQLAWLRGGGYYHETWVEREGEWWLKRLDMHRTYTSMSLVCMLFFILDGFLGLDLV